MSGQTTVERVSRALTGAHASQEALNAFTSIDDEGALERAAALDRRIDAGDDIGPLAGSPVAIKDLIDQANRITTNGSSFYRVTPERSATCISNVEQAGGVVIGRTGLHEFAFGFSSENPFWGAVTNPWDPTTSPGGSSGGGPGRHHAHHQPVDRPRRGALSDPRRGRRPGRSVRTARSTWVGW